MPPKFGSPEHWLLYAESDLALAELARYPKVMLETLCYHAQQAAERSLKAVLIHHQISFAYTHDIAY